MAAKSEAARLVAVLSLDDKMSRGLANAGKSLDKFGDKVGRGLKNTATNLTNIGLIAGGAVVAGLTASVAAASDLAEQQNKVNVVFGKSSKAVLDFAKNAPEAVGLSSAAALEGAGAFGNMFRTIGLGDKVSADFSTRLVTLAADMASFNNEDPSDMLDRLRSGLSGESEPLKRFGVLLNEARVKEEAIASGIAKKNEKLTEAQKVQARYSLILKDSAIQQGDFARTSDSLANAQRTLRATLTNIGATIGTAVLPQVAKLVVRFKDLLLANQPAIENAAKQLPALFDKAIEFGENIPWNTIKDTFIFMGKGAKAALEAFTALPPWVQTAVLTGWGLNKLSGGMLSDIFGSLASGLIKGVLGMNAGVVNIKAGVVTGVGGGGIPGGGALPGAGGVGTVAAGAGLGLAAAVTIVGISAAAVGLLGIAIGKQVDPTGQRTAQGKADTARARGIPDANSKPLADIRRITGKTAQDAQSSLQTQRRSERGIDNVRQAAIQGARDTVRETQRGTTQVQATQRQTAASLAAAQAVQTSRIVSAIFAARPVISVQNVTRTYNRTTNYGPTSGSRSEGTGSSRTGPTHR